MAELPTLVCLHGLLGSRADWQALISALPDPWPQRLIRIDLPGHASAQDQTTSFEQWPAWLASQLQALGVRDLLLYGYSLGGRLALHYAQSAPTDAPRLHGLILEGAHPGLTEVAERRARARQDAGWVRRWHAARTPQAFATVLQDWYAQPIFADLSPSQRAELIALRLQTHTEARSIGRMHAATSLARQPSAWNWLSHSSLPCLYLHGSLDRKFAALATQLTTLNPAIQRVSIQNAGHNAHRAAPAEVAIALCDWWQRQPISVSHQSHG